MKKSQHKTNRVDAYIGIQLRLRREELILTQEMIGNQLRLSADQINSFEEGLEKIGMERLCQLATILDVSPSYFFDGISSTTAILTSDDSDTYDDATLGILINSYSKIGNARIRKNILQLLDSVVEDELSHLGFDSLGRVKTLH